MRRAGGAQLPVVIAAQVTADGSFRCPDRRDHNLLGTRREPLTKGPLSKLLELPCFEFNEQVPVRLAHRQGYWVVKRKTAGARLSRALRAVPRWCRQHRHTPLVWQHAALGRKLHGHYGYYGITGNSVAITRFRWEVRRRWQKWLNRRGARSPMPWPRFERLEQRYPLPAAIAIHSIYRPAAKP